MERSVAIKKLGKLLGKKLGYRINTKAPTQEEKAAAAADGSVNPSLLSTWNPPA